MNRALGALLVAVALAGCSLAGGDEPESATASAQFVTDLIRLGQDESFGQVGLTAVRRSTRVVVELEEEESTTARLAPHITTGNCDVLGSGVVYALNAFRDRVSETVVDIELEPLRRMGYVVLVGDPRFGPTGGVCGDLAKAQPPSAAPTFD
jgi:hypothetical protein